MKPAETVLSRWLLCMGGPSAVILRSMTTGVREMRNIGHVPAYVATNHGAHLPAVSPRSTQGRLHVWGSAIRMWLDRSRQHRALAELDDRLLRDIGVTSAQARREAAKPLWTALRE